MTDTASKDSAAAPPRTPAADEEWARLAASLSADPLPRGAPAKTGAEAPPGVQRAVLSSSVALIFAFVAIGLEFSLRGLKEAGWRPIVLFAAATVVNIVVALGLASILFGGLFGTFGTGYLLPPGFVEPVLE